MYIVHAAADVDSEHSFIDTCNMTEKFCIIQQNKSYQDGHALQIGILPYNYMLTRICIQYHLGTHYLVLEMTAR